MVGDSRVKVIRSFQIPGAATGEGMVHVDANGQHWREEVWARNDLECEGRRAYLQQGYVVPFNQTVGTDARL
jgi:hypothetical protein